MLTYKSFAQLPEKNSTQAAIKNQFDSFWKQNCPISKTSDVPAVLNNTDSVFQLTESNSDVICDNNNICLPEIKLQSFYLETSSAVTTPTSSVIEQGPNLDLKNSNVTDTILWLQEANKLVTSTSLFSTMKTDSPEELLHPLAKESNELPTDCSKENIYATSNKLFFNAHPDSILEDSRKAVLNLSPHKRKSDYYFQCGADRKADDSSISTGPSTPSPAEITSPNISYSQVTNINKKIFDQKLEQSATDSFSLTSKSKQNEQLWEKTLPCEKHLFQAEDSIDILPNCCLGKINISKLCEDSLNKFSSVSEKETRFSSVPPSLSYDKSQELPEDIINSAFDVIANTSISHKIQSPHTILELDNFQKQNSEVSLLSQVIGRTFKHESQHSDILQDENDINIKSQYSSTKHKTLPIFLDSTKNMNLINTEVSNVIHTCKYNHRRHIGNRIKYSNVTNPTLSKDEQHIMYSNDKRFNDDISHNNDTKKFKLSHFPLKHAPEVNHQCDTESIDGSNKIFPSYTSQQSKSICETLANFSESSHNLKDYKTSKNDSNGSAHNTHNPKDACKVTQNTEDISNNQNISKTVQHLVLSLLNNLCCGNITDTFNEKLTSNQIIENQPCSESQTTHAFNEKCFSLKASQTIETKEQHKSLENLQQLKGSYPFFTEFSSAAPLHPISKAADSKSLNNSKSVSPFKQISNKLNSKNYTPPTLPDDIIPATMKILEQLILKVVTRVEALQRTNILKEAANQNLNENEKFFDSILSTVLSCCGVKAEQYMNTDKNVKSTHTDSIPPISYSQWNDNKENIIKKISTQVCSTDVLKNGTAELFSENEMQNKNQSQSTPCIDNLNNANCCDTTPSKRLIPDSLFSPSSFHSEDAISTSNIASKLFAKNEKNAVGTPFNLQSEELTKRLLTLYQNLSALQDCSFNKDITNPNLHIYSMFFQIIKMQEKNFSSDSVKTLLLGYLLALLADLSHAQSSGSGTPNVRNQTSLNVGELNLSLQDDGKYAFDAQLKTHRSSVSSQTENNSTQKQFNSKKPTTEYLCTYPGVSWNTRMQSWLVYYEDARGRKSRTFNPKRLTHSQLEVLPPHIREKYTSDPVEAAMHCACVYAARVRWEGRLRKSLGFQSSRNQQVRTKVFQTALQTEKNQASETYNTHFLRSTTNDSRGLDKLNQKNSNPSEELVDSALANAVKFSHSNNSLHAPLLLLSNLPLQHIHTKVHEKPDEAKASTRNVCSGSAGTNTLYNVYNKQNITSTDDFHFKNTMNLKKRKKLNELVHVGSFIPSKESQFGLNQEDNYQQLRYTDRSSHNSQDSTSIQVCEKEIIQTFEEKCQYKDRPRTSVTINNGGFKSAIKRRRVNRKQRDGA